MAKRIPKQFASLRADVAKYMERWKADGKPVASYRCPHCGKECETTAPTKKEVSKEKPYWDSSQKSAFIVTRRRSWRCTRSGKRSWFARCNHDRISRINHIIGEKSHAR